MIRIFFFIIFVSAVILFFGLVQILLLRQLNRVWWEKKWVRRSAYVLPAAGMMFMVLLGVAEYNRIGWLSAISGPLTVVAVVLEIGLMLSLPVSGLFHLVERLIERWVRSRNHSSEDRPDPRRRLLLRGAAALVPAATVSMGLGGVGRAYAPAEVTLKTFRFDRLPNAFDGFRILHLSDLHLRHYVGLDDLEAMLVDASALSPDLILVTGDIADDLNLLPNALALIAQAKPRLGCFAVLGNHEYFRGITQVRHTFEGSDIPLLIDDGMRLATGGDSLFLGGIDDPMTMHDTPRDYFSASIDKTFFDASEGEFTLMMSHRPDAFPPAAERRIDLTLSGHTHGGQIGFAGRSILERALPESYLWGHYQLGHSQLYTSCGAGHWFPFRLGCPAEAPVIELKIT